MYICSSRLVCFLRNIHRNVRGERRQRLQDVIHAGNALKVALDFGFDDTMSEKELRTLSNQVREVYSSSLRAEDPFHLLFTNYSRTSLLHSLLCRTMNEDPFCLPIDMREEKVTRLFPREDIVFLTPDAVTALETLDKTKVYVLGAVADKTVKKRLTLDAAEGSGIAARRLPIKEYLHQTKPSYTATMTINQVFDILLMYQTTGDWTASLLSAIPPRKGFIARDEDRQTYNK